MNAVSTTKFGLALLLVLGLFVCNAQATLLMYEGFEYEGTELATQDGGDGFSGRWPASSTLELAGTGTTSLDYPSNSSFTSAGQRIKDLNGGSAYRSLDSNAQFDLGQEGIRYVSMLVRKGLSGGISFRMWDINGNDRFTMGINDAEEYYTNIYNDTQAVSGYSLGQTAMMVAKIVAHSSGNDEIYLKVYDTAADLIGDEPATDAEWSLVNRGSGSSAMLMDIRIGTNANSVEVDELRMGTEWADVTGVPEPLTVVLLSAGVLLKPRRRRK